MVGKEIKMKLLQQGTSHSVHQIKSWRDQQSIDTGINMRARIKTGIRKYRQQNASLRHIKAVLPPDIEETKKKKKS